MRTATHISAARETVPDHEQKQLALGYLQEAWTDAVTTASTATAWRRPRCSWHWSS